MDRVQLFMGKDISTLKVDTKKVAEKNSTLVNIRPDEIAPNKDNPRILFDEEDLKYLRESISEMGILVPLIVYEGSDMKKKYTLLDGERRLRCARSLKLPSVPANIVDAPKRLLNILLMFNIHNVRKDWELVPTALKLEMVMRLLPSNDLTNTKIAKITGMSSIRVSECRRILRFKKKYIDLALEPNSSKRIRGEFFSQLALPLDKIVTDFPEITNEYNKEKIIDKMIEKYRDGTIVNHISDFRMLKKTLASPKKGIEKETVTSAVKEFLKSQPKKDDSGNVTEHAMTIKDIFEKTSRKVYNEEAVIKKSDELVKMLSLLDVKIARQSQALVGALDRLSASIHKTLGTM